MTEAAKSARVLFHPTANRRVVEGETLRNAMAASARRRAVAAYKVQAYAIPKDRLQERPSGPHDATHRLPGRRGITALAGVTLVAAGLVMWWRMDAGEIHSPAATESMPTNLQGREATGRRDDNPDTEVAVAVPGYVFTNRTGLKPQVIEAALTPHTPAPMPVVDATPVPRPLVTGAATAVARRPAAGDRPAQVKATVPSKQSHQTTDQRFAQTPPGEPMPDRVEASPAAAKTAASASTKTGPSNQLLQFRDPPQQANGSPGTAKSLGQSSVATQPSRARALSVPVDGMVTVELDGAVRVYRVGQTLPNGQTVLSADATSGKYVLGPPGGGGQ